MTELDGQKPSTKPGERPPRVKLNPARVWEALDREEMSQNELARRLAALS